LPGTNTLALFKKIVNSFKTLTPAPQQLKAKRSTYPVLPFAPILFSKMQFIP
jgi:hypothetical protein